MAGTSFITATISTPRSLQWNQEAAIVFSIRYDKENREVIPKTLCVFCQIFSYKIGTESRKVKVLKTAVAAGVCFYTAERGTLVEAVMC